MSISIQRVLLITLGLITAILLLAILTATAMAGTKATLSTAPGSAPYFDKKITEKILNVIDKYRTGLKEKDKIKITQAIMKQSRIYGYDPLFLTALIITESSFRNWAKSPVGALGLMQIRPRTGKALAREINLPWKGKDTLFDPVKNIALGSYYLDKLLTRFGNLDTALEAYNHGPTRMSRYVRRGKQPIKYSSKVFTIYNGIRFEKPDLELVAYSSNNPQTAVISATGPLLADGHVIHIYRGDTLWRLSKRLGFGHTEASKVAVALWLDNRDAFINGNMHGLEAGIKLNLDNLEYRLATLNPDTVKKIVRNQWQEWLQSNSPARPKAAVQAKSSPDKDVFVAVATAKPGMQKKEEAGKPRFAKTHESIARGDSLWKISERLGFDSKDATRVAVALWLDNMDTFIKANIHGLKAGETLNLENLNHRLATLDRQTASRIIKNQWQEWESA